MTEPERQLLLVLNPGARAGRTQKRWAPWIRGLQQAGYHVTATETISLDHATSLAQQAHNMEAVVACGGDGTISHVLDGLMRQPADARPALGVLYAGTSPDFCRTHRIPTEPEAALSALLCHTPTPIDVGRIVCHDALGEEQIVHFGCGANIGIGATVATRANRMRPTIGDTAGTACAVISALFHRFPTLQLDIDGAASPPLPRCCNLTVAKSPFIASGLAFDAPVSRNDGKLALLGIHSRSAPQLLALLPSMYRGTTASKPNLLHATCRTLDVRADRPCAVEADGDARGWLPAHIEVVPSAINLLGSPPEGKPTP